MIAMSNQLQQSEATFRDVVETYSQNLQSAIEKNRDTTGYSDVPWEDWVMVKKVRKHIRAGNLRKAAKYAAMRLEEFPSKLSRWAIQAMQQTPLRCTKNAVLYWEQRIDRDGASSHAAERFIPFRRAQ
jgi:soluble cytochrome b562